MIIYMFVNVDWFFLSHRLPIAKESTARGFKFKVFTDFTSPHLEDEYDEFLMINSPLKRSSKFIFSPIFEFLRTFSIIYKDKPNIVHAVTIKPIIMLGIICFILKIPFIASISGLGPAFSGNGIFYKFRRFVVKIIYKIIFFPQSSVAICQSSHDANALVSSNIICKNKIIMTKGSGVELEKYKNSKNISSDSINVLMASRLLSDKGVFEFCSAAGKIKKNTLKKDVNFLLAGPLDPHSPRSLSKKYVLDLCKKNNVEYIGNRSDLPNVLEGVDIFVLPSYYQEGMPKVLLEAAASGCAIITTDHPGCRDAIINGETGILVKSQDVESLENAMNSLILEPNLIQSMGENGKKLAEKEFSVKKVVDIHYELYKRLINHNENE